MFKLSSLGLLAFSNLALVMSFPSKPTADPVTVTLSSRKVNHGVVNRRSISPSDVPLQDYFNGTDLQYVINDLS